MNETMVKIENVTKEYRLGAIGGGTLKGDLQSWIAKKRGKEDPNSLLGSSNNFTKSRFLALDNVSISVNRGEALGIIGHNGAGKSTLLKLLSRVTAPTSGTISYNGRIASMLEVGTGFHPELTGRENVYMNGAILGMTKSEISKKFDEIVAFAEMERFIDTPVKRYSSGMYVKLAFAVAAHLDSEIMVMDEVLAVGDVKFQQKCLGRMGDAANTEGRTVLYVSHNMSTIRQLCKRCVVLDHGKVIYDGDVETAIGIYSDSQKKAESHYDFSQVIRPVAKSLAMQFLELDVLNNPENPICVGEILKLRIKCKANQSFSKMRIRFEVKASDDSTVGTMFLNEDIKAKKGDLFDMNLEVDTNNLAPGQYRFILLAFEQNDFGVQDWCDRVEDAPIIIIEKRNAKDLEWLPQWWGHIMLNDIKLLEIKKENKN